MSDLFLPVPDRLLDSALLAQEAVDWLAFGPPGNNLRAGLSLDRQLKSIHTAAGVLLLSLWDGGLPAYVQSPSTGAFYRVPVAYWRRPDAEDMQRVVEAGDVPDTLPGHSRPLDPRYQIDVQHYAHDLPARDLVGKVVMFRLPDVERYISTIGPSSGWQAAVGEALDPSPDRIKPPAPLAKTRGPKFRYDWRAADAAVADHDNLSDIIASIVDDREPQSVLESFMLDWFAQRGDPPSVSSVRSRVAGMVQHRRELNERRGQ